MRERDIPNIKLKLNIKLGYSMMLYWFGQELYDACISFFAALDASAKERPGGGVASPTSNSTNTFNLYIRDVY